MLAAIWGSAFFNYKIVLESFDFFILTAGRLFFAALVLALISIFYKKIDYSPIFTKDFYIFFLFLRSNIKLGPVAQLVRAPRS